MSTIYILTTGEYSDYRIVGAFSSLKQAAHAAELYPSANPTEEYEIDYIPDYPPDCKLYRVDMDVDGNTYCENRSYQVEPEGFYLDLSKKSLGDLSRMWRGCRWYPARVFAIWATDKDEAVKIVNERRIAMLAAGTWDK